MGFLPSLALRKWPFCWLGLCECGLVWNRKSLIPFSFSFFFFFFLQPCILGGGREVEGK